MSDSDPSEKKAGVPSWQLETKEATGPKETPETPETPKTTLIEEAKKFLEKDEIRDESTDKKIAFLESKGLESAEIETLLGVTRNLEATASPPETLKAPINPQPSPISISPPQQQIMSQTGDAPPIITYPEFLTTPIAPSPIVTKTRLLATLYAFAGISALLYGTKTLLVTPMLEQLTEARISLVETASTNVRKLVLQLQNVVSEIPMTISEDKKDEDSEDEDPSELFHRDVGVQTSRPPSPTSYLNPLMDKKLASTVEAHVAKLGSIGHSLTYLLEESHSEGHDTADLSSTIGILREYLDGLAYVTPSFQYGAGGYGAYAAQGKNDDDEISRVKASIRGVKGVLLSARSFPAATRAR